MDLKIYQCPVSAPHGKRGEDTDLRSHDKTRCGWVDCNITGHEADIAKLSEHLTVFLVTQGLHGG